MPLIQSSALPDIASLVPHAGRMLLLDRLLAVDEESLVAEVCIRDDSPFCQDGAVGAWVGIEYMAQCIAAFAGQQRRLQGLAPRVGFLLGTRKQVCHVPRFASGSVLRISASREFMGSDGLSAFSCKIENETGLLAEAVLSVFEPEDADAFLQQSAA